MTTPSQSTLSCVCGIENCAIPFGLCHCGCGETTKIVKPREAAKRFRYKSGFPKLYMPGHCRRLSPVAYIIEDRGYKTPCWIWQRCKGATGYGKKGKDNGDRGCVAAHVWYWNQKNGAIPEGMELDHLCRQRACVNPDHLEPVTGAINTQRGCNATLTREQVISIRARLAKGERQALIATELRVTRTCINAIAKRRTWRNL